MIKKLRKKVILLTMISVFALLAVVVAGMNIINYGNVVATADEVLQFLTGDGGKMADGPGKDDADRKRGDDDKDRQGTATDGAQPPFDKQWKMPRRINDETAYESRFFFAVLDAQGGLIVVDTGRVAAVDSDEAVDIAQEVFDGGKTSGFYGVYRYAVEKEENGNFRLTFLDSRRSLDNFKYFLLASVGMALLGFAVVFVIVYLLSGRIIRPIAESYEKQKRFITDAGHEIKTPLTVINANAELLECDFGKNESIDDIKDQTKRLTALTEKLVYLSKMEETGNKLPMEEFSLSELLNDMTPAFAHLAQANGKRFAAQVPPDVTMRGHAESIERLVSLLLDNAVKYASPEGEITVALHRQGRHIHLSVANPTGEAMSKDDLSR
ncbi:MAG: HAMP domain-containing histidine kinase, partial [Clostridia bacterium]|nr:HAMP domain-containing histidine kinase [Clostridia bacterium]